MKPVSKLFDEIREREDTALRCVRNEDLAQRIHDSSTASQCAVTTWYSASIEALRRLEIAKVSSPADGWSTAHSAVVRGNVPSRVPEAVELVLSSVELATISSKEGLSVIELAAYSFPPVAEKLSNNLSGEFDAILAAVPGLSQKLDGFAVSTSELQRGYYLKASEVPTYLRRRIEAGRLEEGIFSEFGSRLSLINALSNYRIAKVIATQRNLPDIAREASDRMEVLQMLSRT